MAFITIPGNDNWEYDNSPPDPGGALSDLWETGTNGIRTNESDEEIYMNCRHKTLRPTQESVPNEINKTYWDQFITYTVSGTVAGNASTATFSNGSIIDDDFPAPDFIITVKAGENVNLTYSSQNDFDEFIIVSGTVGSSNVDETNFILNNVQSDIVCTIVRTD